MSIKNAKVFDQAQQYKEINKKLNILVVDDEKDSRESITDIIKLRGHNVISLDEGMKCVNRCHKNKYDLILMDYHINDIDGSIGELTGADIIRTLRECFDIDSKIYAYTGDNTNKTIDDLKSANFNGALIKPINPKIIGEFLKILETTNNQNDIGKTLRNLSIKSKNFIYFY